MRCGGDHELLYQIGYRRIGIGSFTLNGGRFHGGSGWVVVYQNTDAKIIPGEFGWEATGLIWRGFVHVMAFESGFFILFRPLALWVISTQHHPFINANTHIKSSAICFLF